MIVAEHDMGHTRVVMIHQSRYHRRKLLTCSGGRKFILIERVKNLTESVLESGDGSVSFIVAASDVQSLCFFLRPVEHVVLSISTPLLAGIV